jgi:hypothetical protein
MAPYTRGKKRDQFVYVAINEIMRYGFKTKDLSSLPGVSASDITALGHVKAEVVASETGKIRILGANAPKPPRVVKKASNVAVGTQQSVSTFCSRFSLGTAQGAGWSIVKPGKGVSLRANTTARNSLTAIAKCSDGSLYCFPLNKADYDTYGAQLGLESSVTITTDTERNKLVSGSSIPRPGKASIELSSGAIFTSFYSHDKADDLGRDGFSLTEEYVLKPTP